MFTSERPHYSLALFSSFICTRTTSKDINLHQITSSLRLRFPFYLGPLSPVYLLVATQGLAAYSCFITQSFRYSLKDLLAQLSASISSLVVSLYAEFKHKSYENDVFIASAISNIFQNYNYCSLEMEQLSLT